MTTFSDSMITYLDELSLFNVLDARERLFLASKLERKKISKHSIIYEKNSSAHSIYFLIKGSVKISQTSDDGREVIKRFLIPGNMFGELALLGGKVYQDNAVSLNDEVEVYQLRAHHLLGMMRDNHELTLHILKWVYERIESMEKKLEAMVLKDARARIIDFLKETANKVGRKVGFELLIKLSLTQQDIANIVGTSRQTVTTVLNELKRENLIHFNRRSILIRDISKLV